MRRMLSVVCDPDYAAAGLSACSPRARRHPCHALQHARRCRRTGRRRQPAPATKPAHAPGDGTTEGGQVPKPTAPAASAPATKSAAPPAASNGKLTFNFRYQPWQDVLDWFAQQNDMSLVIESPPPGTFNYRDGREYTPAECLTSSTACSSRRATLSSVTAACSCSLNLEDGIPPNLVPDVPVADLDQHGEYEIMRLSAWT